MTNKNTLRKNLAKIIARAGLSLGITLFTLNTIGCEYCTKTQKPEQKSSQDYDIGFLDPNTFDYNREPITDRDISFVKRLKEELDEQTRTLLMLGDPNFLNKIKPSPKKNNYLFSNTIFN